MTKTLNRMTKAWILIVGISIFFTACEKETTDEIITQEKFDAPSIELAEQYVNSNSTPSSSNATNRNSSSDVTSVTHWEGSKTKKYKETEELDVDILYTPIYVNSTRTDIKGFVASTEQNGIVDSRTFFILYKSNDLSNGLNAYILIYGLDGNLEMAYNFVNGQSIPLPESSNGGSTLNRSNGECDVDVATLNTLEFINWWINCNNAIDEVDLGTLPLSTQGGNNSGSTSAFNDWNNLVNVYIPAVTNPNGSSYNNGNTNGNNTPWHTPNVTVANAVSISTVLNAEYNSAIANWLREMEQTNQQILNQIADYLNANREENPFHDLTFGNIQPEQFPVSEEAIDFISDFIQTSITSDSESLGAMQRLITFMRQYGEAEHEIVADYFESIVQEYDNMTASERQFIHGQLVDIKNDILWAYVNAVVGTIVSDLVIPVVTYALFEAGGSFAIKLIQKIPLPAVLVGTRLNKMVQRVAQLGVQGEQVHVRIVATSSPVAKAEELFISLTRNAVSVAPPNAQGTIVANMGNGNFITFRTVSSSNFPATINLNFPSLFGSTPRAIKFTTL